MARYALVIGISKYDKLPNLPKATTDAEAIAQILEQHGDFYKIDRLPKRWVAAQDRYEVAPDKGVTADELFNAIKNLLQEAEKQEVLIYFAGHGFRIASRAGKQRGFLATSDSAANGQNAIALDDDLNALLDQSNLSSLVILLDCCHAGALLEADLTRQVIEPSLSSFNAPRDFYLITACRAAERSREGAEHGIFTAAVLAGLAPSNANPETGRVSVNRLFDSVYQNLQSSGQEPFQLGGGRSITLVTYPAQNQTMPAMDDSIVPYRGLEPFEKEQAAFFFGRKQVVEDIWKALDRGNFVAVIGASGSGKSSAVRAGLVPWLEAGGWQVLHPMKPGVSPLAKLAATFEPRFPDHRSQKQLDEFIHTNPEGLRQLADQLPGSAKFLLVVDQFEEVFTLSRTDERQKLIDLLTQIAEAPHPRLAIVTTMRADFLEPCLQYSKLTHLIQTQAIFMPPLIGADLEQAIVEPAKRLGYALEPGLLGEILHDVGQEPGCLPLLQFALLELWERRDRQNRRLTCLAYEEMNGVLGALDHYAEQIYEQLIPVEQHWAKRLCLKLVRTGMELNDTRRRQPKQRLLELSEDNLEQKQFAEATLQHLIDVRLLISGDTEGEAWIDLAHEALMKEWQRFARWRRDNWELRRLCDRVEDSLSEWQKDPVDINLMMGGLLTRVREQWQNLEPELNFDSREFVQRSDAFEKLLKRESKWPQAQLDIQKQLRELGVGWSRVITNPLQDLLTAIKIAGFNLDTGPGDLLKPVRSVLLETCEYSREQNYFQGHQGSIHTVTFSPEGSILATGGADRVIRLWNLEGNAVASPFQGHESAVRSIAFSPDGQTLVSGGDDGTVRLWDIQGNLRVLPFQGHKYSVRTVAFSPDGKMIASGSHDRTIRLWDSQGMPIGHPFREVYKGHEDSVWSLDFSPDGQMLVSGSADRTVRLWDLQGKAVTRIFRQHQYSVCSVKFSPDGALVASGSDDKTVCLWDLNGDLLAEINGHQEPVKSIAFSPDSQIIASGGRDGPIYLWDRQGNSANASQPFIIWGSQPGDGSTNALAFSPNGQLIASGHEVGTIRIWGVHPLRIDTDAQQLFFDDSQALLKLACDRLRYHPVLQNATTEEAKAVCKICQKYVWDQEE